MKSTKKILMFGIVVSIALIASQWTFADLSVNDVVANFNAMNGGQGYKYQVTPWESSQYYGLLDISHINFQSPDLSAYAVGKTTNGTNKFQSFCVEPQVVLADGGATGILNYAGGNTTADNYNAPLTFGAAYLYKQFATGNLTSYDYDGDRKLSSIALKDAIHVLMGTAAIGNAWTQNIFLQQLISFNYDRDFWMAYYDPAKNTADYQQYMGDYGVLVVNSFDSVGKYRQDFLYTFKNGGTDVPEPGTMLLWALGMAGASAYGVKRHRNAKKA